MSDDATGAGGDRGTDDATGTDGHPESPDETEIVQKAAEAAETVVFSRYERTEVRDLDVTVTFDEGQLEVDVYFDAPDAGGDPGRVAEDAALAARGVVDDMLS